MKRKREREGEGGCFLISILSSRFIKFAKRTCSSRSRTGARNPAGRKHDSATQNAPAPGGEGEREREKDEHHRQLLKNASPIIPFLSPL